VSRAVVRSYGGDLRFEPQSKGASFVVELQVAEHQIAELPVADLK
jgi:C4-dicarboxylate-specific signal transduction histidine kinase